MSAFMLQAGDLVMGQGTPYVIKPPIDGLDSAPIRTSSFNYAGQDGGDVPEQFYGIRQVSIPGTIVSPDCADHDDHRKALRDAFPIRRTVTLLVTTFSGRTYRVTGKVGAFDMPIVGEGISDFKVELLCGDPTIYDEGALVTVTIAKKVSGGYETPYILPVTWEASSLPAEVVNAGESTIYPLITIRGDATNPIITNRTTGEVMEVDVTIRTGDELVIDMMARTATLNGGSVIGLKTMASTWWGLLQGLNQVDLDSLNGTDSLTAVISWNSGQTGI